MSLEDEDDDDREDDEARLSIHPSIRPNHPHIHPSGQPVQPGQSSSNPSNRDIPSRPRPFFFRFSQKTKPKTKPYKNITSHPAGSFASFLPSFFPSIFLCPGERERERNIPCLQFATLPKISALSTLSQAGFLFLFFICSISTSAWAMTDGTLSTHVHRSYRCFVCSHGKKSSACKKQSSQDAKNHNLGNIYIYSRNMMAFTS